MLRMSWVVFMRMRVMEARCNAKITLPEQGQQALKNRG